MITFSRGRAPGPPVTNSTEPLSSLSVGTPPHGWWTASPLGSQPIRLESVAPPCTPVTSTCTGPATRPWPSVLPTPYTPRPLEKPPLVGEAPFAAPTHRRHQVPQRSTRWTALPDAEPDLHHHGDQDLGEGLVDLAVNVRLPRPPDCLIEIINETTAQLAAYPRPEKAIAAISSAHGLPENQALPSAGGAEAFTLIARATQPRHPVVIHPQFTEPEAALIAAGHVPERVMTRAENDFRLDPASVPKSADLIMIGNPTNPTSVLHPAVAVGSLLGPGRVVVVDEAFMDAVPEERESMIGDDMTGLVVVRSLTKTWGLAGIRAGYVVGDADVLTRMRRQQPPWSVSTPALAVMTACLSPEAREMTAEAALEIANNRAVLLDQLAGLGLSVARHTGRAVPLDRHQPAAWAAA